MLRFGASYIRDLTVSYISANAFRCSTLVPFYDHPPYRILHILPDVMWCRLIWCMPSYMYIWLTRMYWQILKWTWSNPWMVMTYAVCTCFRGSVDWYDEMLENKLLQLNAIVKSLSHHTMDLLWEKFQWILPLYMKPISFQSKASVVCSVTTAIFIDFCLKKLNVFSHHIGEKTNEHLNSAEQIPRNWNVDQLSVLITSWDIT